MQQIIAAGGALPAGIPPWLAAQAAAAFATEACECCTRRYPQAAVKSLAERRPPIVPTVNAFAAPGLPNAHERQILVDFLAAQGLDAAALLRECLRRVEAGTLTLAHPSFPARALTPATRLCEGCATTIFATLAYAYRAAIPPAQLPPAVTARSTAGTAGSATSGTTPRTPSASTTSARPTFARTARRRRRRRRGRSRQRSGWRRRRVKIGQWEYALRSTSTGYDVRAI